MDAGQSGTHHSPPDGNAGSVEAMAREAASTTTASAAAVEPTLELLNRAPITYKSALNTDSNMIHEAGYVAATRELYRALWMERHTIGPLAKHHLGLGSRDSCTVARPAQWIRGSFNVCIPVEVQSPSSRRRLILRCAMPHKLAEAEYPGTMDEKMGCEVGTYAWMQERCPDIRIPHLYGFGFSDHRQFTHEAHRPLYVRLIHRLRRLLYGLVGYSTLSHYTAHPSTHRLPTAYVLLEDVRSDTSQMLSNTWEKQRGDQARRQRLFRGMSRLMLSLARVPQPRIGSFQFHDDGTITLTNRPLNCSTMILENDGTPRAVQRNRTYLCTEPYVADLFSLHEKRFLSHPNAIYDDKDCRGEMAAKVLLRALAHRYVRQEQRNGPFFLQLSDLHASNMFVDEEWNVTCLIDLEWVCALPVEMLDVPYWLTGCAIDGIRGERLAEFDKVRQEFMDVFDDEEGRAAAEHGLELGRIMRETWETGGVWFWYSMTSVNAMEEELVSKFWSEDAATVVETKVEAYEGYAQELKGLFGQGAHVKESQ